MNAIIARDEKTTIDVLATGLSYLHKCAEKRRLLRGQSNGQPDLVSVSSSMWLATAAVNAGITSRSRVGYRDKSTYEKQAHPAIVKIEWEIPLLWRTSLAGKRLSISGIDARVSATELESSTNTLLVCGIASSKIAIQKIKAKTECVNAFTHMCWSHLR